MNWTTAADIRRVLLKHWESGRLLTGRVPGHTGLEFPLRIVLRRPRAADLSSDWDAVRQWAADLLGAPDLRIETRPIGHRVLGTQSLPVAAWIDSADDALRQIHRTRQAARFDELVAATQQTNLDWAAQHPLKLIEIGEDWVAVQTAAAWLHEHPDPGIHLRQTDIPGVHTKVIEQHKRVIADLVPGPATAGSGWFERRYGFRVPDSMVRFRVLDDALCLLPGVRDMSLPVPDFLRLCPPARIVFVTENLTNFLCFPSAPQAMVVFGAGNEAPELLAGLSARAVVYTGDLDTHGLAILDRFRAHLPHTRSMLMDLPTLQAHRRMWVTEKTQITRDLPHLRGGEQELYDALRHNTLGEHVRLEQERIRFGDVREAVVRVAGG